MSHMIIDGRKVEFTDEKNVLSVIRKAGINIPTLFTTPSFPHLVPVVCVPWKMTEERCLHPVRKSRETAW